MNNQAPFRLSKQRMVILTELRKLTCHPTADELYERIRKIMPRISLGTVYRNLDFLTSQGMIQKVGPGGTQMRFDGNAAPHGHIRCSICNKVEDLPGSIDFPALSPESSLGYDVSTCVVEFVGVCPECQDGAGDLPQA